MEDKYFRPIAVNSIIPSRFPAVALYVRSGSNVILYKPFDRPFTDADRSRMLRNNTRILFVRSGDMEDVNAYLENNLTDILAQDLIKDDDRCKIIYQTLANYLTEIFEQPGKVADVARCRNLVEHLIRYIIEDTGSLRALQNIANDDFFVFFHSIQVASLMILVHKELFAPEHAELVEVGVGSLLHDFGFTLLSSEILTRADAITDMDYVRIKQHPQSGYEYLLATGKYSATALTIVRHHHERLNGFGFPQGLKGDKIPWEAQTAAICDVYSSLTSDQGRRKASPHKEALRIMRVESSGSFNPKLFTKFADLINSRLVEDKKS